MTLEEHGVIVALKPSREGWRYEQEWLDRLWRIPETGSAANGDKLVEAVESFRATNGLPPGDPVRDVAEYIKRVSPNNDRWKGRKVGAPRIREITPMISDLRAWVDETAARKPRFVLNEDAKARALICLACPQNINWEVSGCGACNDEVERRSYLLRQAKTVPGELALKACRLHRCHLPSAVHLDRDFLPPRHPDAPGPCWAQKK